jgi:magnesium chelatase family protein
MVKGAILRGIRATPIDIEVGLSRGTGIKIVGLPKEAVRESVDRLRHALPSAGFVCPQQAITINLAPAGLQKREAGLDLALALSLLLETGQIKAQPAGPVYAFGELALDGRVKICKGALSVGKMVPEGAILIAPKENELELALLRLQKGMRKNFRPYVVESLTGVKPILS